MTKSIRCHHHRPSAAYALTLYMLNNSNVSKLFRTKYFVLGSCSRAKEICIRVDLVLWLLIFPMKSIYILSTKYPKPVDGRIEDGWWPYWKSNARSGVAIGERGHSDNDPFDDLIVWSFSISNRNLKNNNNNNNVSGLKNQNCPLLNSAASGNATIRDIVK